MKLIKRFMRFFFDLLYHPFAFTYDLVAAAVSLGHWKDWVFSVIPFIGGTRILELGHGPGHLQRLLLAQPLVRNRSLSVIAMDESAQMGTLASRRLGSSHKLTRALAQKIPFATGSFDSLVSTFPSEYIFDKQTLAEAYRVLDNGGRLVVLLAAWPNNAFLAWFYKVTGESPAETYEAVKPRIYKAFAHTKFTLEFRIVEVKSSNLLIVIAGKEEQDVKKIT